MYKDYFLASIFIHLVSWLWFGFSECMLRNCILCLEELSTSQICSLLWMTCIQEKNSVHHFASIFHPRFSAETCKCFSLKSGGRPMGIQDDKSPYQIMLQHQVLEGTVLLVDLSLTSIPLFSTTYLKRNQGQQLYPSQQKSNLLQQVR